MKKTMGQMIDEAIKQHEKSYPESRVYRASIQEHEFKTDLWVIEVEATHFSAPMVYYQFPTKTEKWT